MKLNLKMWVELSNYEEITAFEFVDEGESASLICDDEESLLLSLNKCQEIIDVIRGSLKK
ncbi:hypothetical protein [Xenorhabdus sp. SGI246]|uniref:hypothetical protein n=1 Tax=Xenorhabdus sp. SGI246 TaxID=3158263 RepID=UPI00349F68BC